MKYDWNRRLYKLLMIVLFFKFSKEKNINTEHKPVPTMTVDKLLQFLLYKIAIKLIEINKVTPI